MYEYSTQLTLYSSSSHRESLFCHSTHSQNDNATHPTFSSLHDGLRGGSWSCCSDSLPRTDLEGQGRIRRWRMESQSIAAFKEPMPVKKRSEEQNMLHVWVFCRHCQTRSSAPCPWSKRVAIVLDQWTRSIIAPSILHSNHKNEPIRSPYSSSQP